MGAIIAWPPGRGFALVAGPSGPMLLFRTEATCDQSIGPEGPPTKVLLPAGKIPQKD
ncbi:DUF6053 domain-containing protein [Lysobacter yananisis]|uniref:DUF6053 domain-containing protein n=1 Tax=Lysobacter yananisis TaxID=1003114 RepID=UPI003CE50532